MGGESIIQNCLFPQVHTRFEIETSSKNKIQNLILMRCYNIFKALIPLTYGRFLNILNDLRSML